MSSARPLPPLPLAGRRVLVTRPEGQAASLAALLEAAGADARVLPVIRIVPPEDPAPLEAAARAVDGFAWLVLTSPNGVDAFAAALARATGASLAEVAPRIAAIGPGTAASVEALGRAPDVVPDEYVGEAVAAAVIGAGGGALEGQRVLLPRAEVARDALPKALAAAGARVEVVTAYRTIGPDPTIAAQLREAVREGGVDAVTFTASSTVRFLVETLGDGAAEALARLTVASIGPITTRTADALGVRVDVTAREYTNRGLVEALSAFYAPG